MTELESVERSGIDCCSFVSKVAVLMTENVCQKSAC